MGVNRFESDDGRGKDKKIFRISKKATSEQVKRLNEVKKKRDRGRVRKALGELKVKVNTDENLMYQIIQCVEAYVSIGEICQVLKDQWGEYDQKVII